MDIQNNDYFVVINQNHLLLKYWWMEGVCVYVCGGGGICVCLCMSVPLCVSKVTQEII